ncbi:MFS transporter [Rhodocytophaga aerolata]|uniref:MFS transporter n=1 Tax=Rhodocytophaga aerolata TaxID=455078 RepID=A0ABT8R3S7_9BACT|nr:MFS transporter [Rhodocytophaga aerolata]MDO1446049.1 MFS transporter [Rhodocytophaga aerolata]
MTHPIQPVAAQPDVYKNNKKVVNAWCSYDWANSVYNLTITATIFPVYYSAVTRAAYNGEVVNFFGVEVQNTVLYSYAISFSFLVIVVLSPVLSGIADYSGKKKRFMQFFTYLGSLACLSLYLFTGENVAYGIICSVLASIGYAGALVFYNAFLPEIVTPDRMDKISARGFSMGYIGSVVLLLVNVVIISNPELVGMANTDAGKLQATRLAFLMVGIWWLSFSQIAFYYLKDIPTHHKVSSGVLTKGFHELSKVVKNLVNQVPTLRFLSAFFFYSMGVQTVMLLAPLYGEAEIHLAGDKLILTVLILQIVAILGAQVFARIATVKGNKLSIAIAIVIWAGVCIGAYFLQTETQFYILAAFLGLVMGGIQSVSRSTYAKLIPVNTQDTASYFSLYDVSEKLAIVLGTFSYGLILQLTGSMRNSAAFMIVFFAIGFFFLMQARLPKPMRID